MHQQKILPPKIKALEGVAIVLGLLAAALVDSFVSAILTEYVNEILSVIVFWAVGIGLALWVIRKYVLGYSYSMNTKLVRVAYSYGRRERVMIDIYFANVLACGEYDAMRQAYPDARITRAARSSCDLEKLTVACRDNGKVGLFVLQPDDEIRAALQDAADAARMKKKK